jgi:acetyltransferase-like isoleucine patch superfamily enzyme
MSIFSSLKRAIQIIKTGRFDVIPGRMIIGNSVYIGSPVYLDPFDDGGLIKIDDNTVISAGVTILVHDASSNRKTGLILIAPVNIGKRVFIGAGATILPGITIGDDAVIGACSVVTQDVNSGELVVGNPARMISRADELHEKRKRDAQNTTILTIDPYQRRFPNDNTHLNIHDGLNLNKYMYIYTNEDKKIED